MPAYGASVKRKNGDEDEAIDPIMFVENPGLDLDIRMGATYTLNKIRQNSDTDGVLIRNCDTPTGKGAKNIESLKEFLELMAIFEAVTLLPDLTRFQLHFAKKTSNEKPHVLPVQLLSIVVNQCLDLSYIRLQGVKLTDTGGKYDGLANALLMHPTVRRIHMILCAPDEELTMDPILKAFPLMPTLREVVLVDTYIATPETHEKWSGDSLLHLALSKNLQTVRLSCIPYLHERHIQAMALAHEKSETLRELTIEGEEEEMHIDNEDVGDKSKDEKERKKSRKKKKELISKVREDIAEEKVLDVEETKDKKKDKKNEKKKDKDEKKESKKDKEKKKKKSNWSTATAPNGKTYYYNKKTGETSWTKPDDL